MHKKPLLCWTDLATELMALTADNTLVVCVSQLFVLVHNSKLGVSILMWVS